MLNTAIVSNGYVIMLTVLIINIELCLISIGYFLEPPKIKYIAKAINDPIINPQSNGIIKNNFPRK